MPKYLCKVYRPYVPFYHKAVVSIGSYDVPHRSNPVAGPNSLQKVASRPKCSHQNTTPSPQPTLVPGTERLTRQATHPTCVICCAILVPAITWLFVWHILQGIFESKPPGPVRILFVLTYILAAWFYTFVFVCAYRACVQPCYWLDMGAWCHGGLVSIRQPLTRMNMFPCRFEQNITTVKCRFLSSTTSKLQQVRLHALPTHPHKQGISAYTCSHEKKRKLLLLITVIADKLCNFQKYFRSSHWMQ